MPVNKTTLERDRNGPPVDYLEALALVRGGPRHERLEERAEEERVPADNDRRVLVLCMGAVEAKVTETLHPHQATLKYFLLAEVAAGVQEGRHLQTNKCVFE